ncbi:MAG: FtsK/SpoIIIE domain-containing protein [Candidatus Dormibacteria bacterium]
MGVRYTTQSREWWDPVGIVLRLLRQLALWVAFLTLSAGPALGWSQPLTLAAAGIFTVVTVLLTLHSSRWSVSARLRRAMAGCGLAGRDARGRVLLPKARLGALWVGRNVTLRWRMPPGVTLADVLNRQASLEARCDCALRCWEEPGVLVMEVLRHRIPDQVPYRTFYSGPRPHGRCLIGLGLGRRGALWVDLDSCPHLLVGGMTGGGKSVFLRQALTFLCCDHPPERLRLALIDLKGGVELAHFSYLPHALFPVADSVAAAAETLTAVREELDRRLSMVRHAVEAGDSAAPVSWPRIVVVVDEVAELTVRDLGDDRAARAAQQAATGRLCEIARLGRSVDIHLVCCTQRPDADAVPGQLKANLDGTVAFRVRAAINSFILLDSDRAALLPPHPGRAVWAHETVEEFQAVDCSLEESRDLLLARWGGRGSMPPGVPVTPWWQNTEFRDQDEIE